MRISRVIMLFLAGVPVVMSTACSEDVLGLFGGTSSSALSQSASAGSVSSTVTSISSSTSTGSASSQADSVVYNGETYTGMGTVLNSASPVRYTYDKLVITSPAVARFEADGFFTLRGSNTDVSSNQYSVVYVTNLTTPSPRAYWFVRGNFEQRIWLPFGPGRYRVTVHKTTMTSQNLDYEGAISGWSYNTSSVTNGVYTFIVENTRNEDGRFYYPSYFVQSDHALIRSKATALLSGVSGVSNQIRRIHDFVVTNLEYDYSSISTNVGKRKRQDAVAALENRMGVCEGYAQLYAAILRSAGFEAKYISGDAGGGHAWNAVFDGLVWRYIDTTWDDPGPNSHLPTNLRYTYFWMTYEQMSADHTQESENPTRVVTRRSRGSGLEDVEVRVRQYD